MKRAGRRLAVGLEYDGTRYAGWQQQPGLPSIQACLQQALSEVADHPVAAVGAGRTDAGVHAVGQVAHFDTTAERPLRGWVLGANSLLPPDIALQWAREVEPGFHARHSAQARRYRYCWLQRPTRPAILRDRAAGGEDLGQMTLDELVEVTATHEEGVAAIGLRDKPELVFEPDPAPLPPMSAVETSSAALQGVCVCVCVCFELDAPGT